MKLRAFVVPHFAALRGKYPVTFVANISNTGARPVRTEVDSNWLHRQLDKLHLRDLDSLLKAQAHER
jgi:hypothetical protein